MKDEKYLLDIVNVSALAKKIGATRQALAYSREHAGGNPRDLWCDALVWLGECGYDEFLDVVVWARLPGFLERPATWPTLQKRVRKEGTREQRALEMALLEFRGVGEPAPVD